MKELTGLTEAEAVQGLRNMAVPQEAITEMVATMHRVGHGEWRGVVVSQVRDTCKIRAYLPRPSSAAADQP
jgi:hypothetical protein